MLEALGIDFELRPGDVAARGNFCTVDAQGRITDRRAGRIPTSRCVELVERLRRIRLPGLEVFVEPVKEHRLVLVLRGPGLSGRLSETDPQAVGRPPLPVEPLAPEAETTAARVNQFVREAPSAPRRRRPREHGPAARLRPAAGPAPLSRGLRAPRRRHRRLPHVPGPGAAGRDGRPEDGRDLRRRGADAAAHWDAYDFFFLHYKDTDKAGEDGDFPGKVAALERLDAELPGIEALRPDVLVVTGDHASPAVLKGHSWHPVPVMVAGEYAGTDAVQQFSERACAAGSLGLLPSHHLMPIVMATALRFTKFGA